MTDAPQTTKWSPDVLTIRRVANGWIILPGTTEPGEFTHIAASPEQLASHVERWAKAQGVARQ